MKRFSILDIRGPWVPARRDKRRADTDCPAPDLESCRVSDSVLFTNAPCSCDFLSQPY